MSEELKPCPFCGGEHVELICMGTREDDPHVVECDDCDATASGMDREEAVANWNRRAGQTCHVESSRTEWEDGEYSYLDVELSCGHAFTWDDVTPPDFCPYCGAKVVE